jgi:glycerol-3-phosphate dehydrogenase (NAD(P)+)
LTKTAVLGAGSWGTTIASLLAPQQSTTLWARRPAVAAEVAAAHTNRTYLGSYQLPEELGATSVLDEALEGASLVVVAVPSHGLRDVLELAGGPPPGVPILSLIKGLERDSLLRATQIIEECWPGHPLGVLTGPNLAEEVLEGQPTASVVAMADEALCRELQARFSSRRLRIYTNHDVIGCEIAGVVKNVMAIACGMSIGLGFGDNTRGALITRALAELARLGVALGGEQLTFTGLAGLGDLVATCTSAKSRNFRLGVALGEGRELAEVLGSTPMIAEGVQSCGPVVELARRAGVEAPVAEQVLAVLEGRCAPLDSIPVLMGRAAKAEFQEPPEARG